MQRATPQAQNTVSRCLTTALVAALLVTACGGDGIASSEPTREYALRLRAEEQGDRYTYIAEDPVDVRAGDRVTFEMDNAGLLIHDLVVVAQDGSAIATAPAVGPGQSLSLTVDFAEPGAYRLRCNVDDHLTLHDMQVVIEVKEPDADATG